MPRRTALPRDFDTAPMYSNGAAEQRLGGAMASIAAADATAALARITTKTGRLVRRDGAPIAAAAAPGAELSAPEVESRELMPDYSGDGAGRSLAESLGRLGLPHVFSLRVHDCDGAGAPPSADNSDDVLAPGGHLAGLVALRVAGHIKQVSLGMNAHTGFG